MSLDLSGGNSSSITEGNTGINPVTIGENLSMSENLGDSQEDCVNKTGSSRDTETAEVDQESET